MASDRPQGVPVVEPPVGPVVTGATPVDKVLSVDTEYDPNGNLLTIAIANRTHARVWDISDGIEGA